MLQRKNLPHELLLTIRQTTKRRNAFENNMSADKRLSETQMSKINHSGGFLRGLLSKIADLLMKVVVPSAKNILALLEITIAASRIDTRI